MDLLNISLHAVIFKFTCVLSFVLWGINAYYQAAIWFCYVRSSSHVDSASDLIWPSVTHLFVYATKICVRRHWKLVGGARWHTCAVVSRTWEIFILSKGSPSNACVIIYNVSVTIATRCGLDGTGIDSRWRKDFPLSSRPALGPSQLPIQWIPAHFSGGKATVAWR